MLLMNEKACCTTSAHFDIAAVMISLLSNSAELTIAYVSVVVRGKDETKEMAFW